MGPKKSRKKELFNCILENCPGLTLSERAMLTALAGCGNSDGTSIHPSHKYLAKHMEISEKYASQLIGQIKEKGYLVEDGKLSYVKQYRLVIPGFTLEGKDGILDPMTPFVNEDLGDSLDEEEDLEETQPRLRIVRPQQPAETSLVAYQPPETPLPVLTQEEKLQKDLAFLWDCVNMAREGKAFMTYALFMNGGRRRGISDEYLNWMWNFDDSDSGGNTGSSLSSHHTEDEPAIAEELVPRVSSYQTGM